MCCGYIDLEKSSFMLHFDYTSEQMKQMEQNLSLCGGTFDMLDSILINLKKETSKAFRAKKKAPTGGCSNP